MEERKAVFTLEGELKGAPATRALGAALGSRLRAGDVVGLSGAMGTGKSELARAAVRAIVGEDTAVPSPSYPLVYVYEKEGLKVAHVDLYRTTSAREAEALEMERMALEGAVLLVEWPERLGAGGLGGEALTVELTERSAESRFTKLSGLRRWFARASEALAAAGAGEAGETRL